MEANYLHFVRRCVPGDLLEYKCPRVFSEIVVRLVTRCPKIVYSGGRDINQRLQYHIRDELMGGASTAHLPSNGLGMRVHTFFFPLGKRPLSLLKC
jgi:hypothetical protein